MNQEKKINARTKANRVVLRQRDVLKVPGIHSNGAENSYAPFTSVVLQHMFGTWARIHKILCYLAQLSTKIHTRPQCAKVSKNNRRK